MVARFIPSDLLATASCWLTTYFVGAAAAALRAGSTGQPIGKVLEGWRISETPAAIAYDSRAAAEAVWVAVCLNQPGYEELLPAESARLGRLGLNALKSLRVLLAPPQVEGLSARLREILDEQMLASDAFHRIRIEAIMPIAGLAAFDARARLSRARQGARVLRLSEVGIDLLVPSPDNAVSPQIIPRRTLAKPLVLGEVLLSTLGRSFRAACVDDNVPPDTFPVEGSVRLRLRGSPAARALLLATEPLRSRAARLTGGSVQQFVPPEALRSLRVPPPPRDWRDRWQRAVERSHVYRRVLDRQWSVFAKALSAGFDAVHRPFAHGRQQAGDVLQ
ncbi:hypothetical protein [Bradyrhizobium sp. SZCCHNR1015]|uniref:hypothetical protein n=1 Tax=Bradyrhizobium sp. SZCCHNR1015 TaxID=3057338 RepID=UPI00291606D2|nr:hypothetical protein [Bradyrhizobium sp. SZCCHNR1015]